MNIVSKAYEARTSWSKSEDFDLYHANTANEAKGEIFRAWEDIPYIDIRVRRNKALDLIENTPHKLVSSLSDSQIEKMLHTSGLSDQIESYRNYYLSSDTDSDLEDLVNKDLMTKYKVKFGTYYYLTDLGMKVIASTQPIFRYHLVA